MKRKAVVFYFEYRARIASWKLIARHPRGSGTRSFCKHGARGKTNGIQSATPARVGRRENLCAGASNPGKTDVKNCGILCFVQDVPMPGRSGPTWWSLQNRGSSRPRSRAKRGGRAPEAPKGGRRVSRRGEMIRPHHAKPAGGTQHSPKKSFRGTRPARPAGGGTNAFCFPSMGEPAPPRHWNILHGMLLPEILYVGNNTSYFAQRISRLPTRAGAVQSFFKKQSPRVYPRNCYRTHFQYPNAFLQHFRIPLYFVFPAPTSPPVGAGRGTPGRGQRPLRANLFRLLFRSLGKVAPAEQNKQKIIAN